MKSTTRTSRHRLQLLLLILASLPLLASQFEYVYAKEVVTVGVYNNKPTIFTDENGKVRGLFIDVLEDIGAREGWKLEYVEDHFAALLQKTKNGQLDLLPAVAYAKSRTAFLDYTYETVMANWAELYVRQGQSLTSLLNLKGKIVAVKQGDIHFKVLKELVKNFNISCRFFETDSYVTVFEMVHSNIVDVGLVNRLFGNARKDEFSVKETPVIFNPIEMRFAVQKGTHQELLNTIDTNLTAMKSDQTSAYYRSLNRWFLTDSDPGLPSWFYRVVGLSLGATLLFLLTAVIFRHQVRKKTEQLRESNTALKEEIEQRTEAQKRLHKLAKVVETSGDGMALLDRGHCHLFFNQVYRNLFFNTTITSGSTNLVDIVGERFFLETLQQPIAACLQGQTTHLQCRPPVNTAEKRFWDITFSPYFSDEATLDGYVIDIRDISNQVALENRLKNSQKMEAIGLLAGGVAHDLNNILSGVVSYPDMLLMNLQKDDPMTAPLTTIKKSGERAAAIVQDLLSLARNDIGSSTILQLNDLITDYLDSLESSEFLANNEGIDINLNLDRDLLCIKGSSIHLQKIIMNLFTNGVEAMPSGGTLTISTENIYFEYEHLCYEAIPPGEYAVMHIRDSGIGMAPLEISRIFEPFYTNKIMGRSGTGLGMTVVWGTVKAHLGFIDIDSSPGEGTVFSIYFPATQEKVSNTTFLKRKDLQGKGELILVVDDLASQQEIASQILELLGYRVALADSGEAAIRFCERTKPDLILLDMVMPGGIDGLATFKAIKKIHPNQKAILASGYSETAKVQEAQRQGAGAYLKKPYSVKAIGDAIIKELSPTPNTDT